MSEKKYQIIYADPPWQYKDKALAGNRGACCKYPVMTTYQIRRLAIEKLTDENCTLFIWSTWPMYNDVLRVITDWGFEYKTVAFLWIKKNNNGTWFKGLGNWTRSNSEYCLLATKGKPRRINTKLSQIIESIPRQHSKKPNIVRDKIIQLCGNLPRIELFARTRINGWDVWGNDDKLYLEPLEAFTS